MSLMDSVRKIPHLISTMPFLLLQGRLEMPSPLLSHFTIQGLTGPVSEKLPHAVLPLNTWSSCPAQNVLSPPLLPRTPYLPFGVLSNHSPTPHVWGWLFSLPKCTRLTRYPEGFWHSGWVQVSGRHRGEWITPAARMVPTCSFEVPLTSQTGRIEGSELSVITTDHWAWAAWVGHASALSCLPSPNPRK